MPTFTAEQLEKVCFNILKAAGVSSDKAEKVVNSLVASNLVGHDSHGIIRLPEYLERIEKGYIKPRARIVVVRETPSIALLDGNWGFGQIIAEKGMKMAIEKAKTTSIGAVGVFHCNHIGRLGEYSMMAVEHGMIGLIMCNSGLRGGLMSPYGGKTRRLGSNAISVAVPARKEKPFLLDFATSVVSEGKIRVSHYRGEQIPTGWILDKNGHPTNNPRDLYIGGMLLPFGAYKGYGLSLLVEMLGGALTGTGCTSSKEFETGSNGTFMMAINVSSFTPLDKFTRRIDDLLKKIKRTPPAPGHSEVLIPGERGFRTEEHRLKEGIFVSDQTWKLISKAAEDLGLDLKRIVEWCIE